MGLGSGRDTEMSYVYHTDEHDVINCELLHEFLESYQIKYVDPQSGEEVEKIVDRNYIREVFDGRLYQ